MFTNRLFYLLVVIAVLVAAACTPTAEANLADRFAGTWSGVMSFTDQDNTEDVFVTIPSGCEAGEVCGEIFNSSVHCTWEMQLETVNRNVLEYTFSRTLSGECPAMSSGTLTLQEDGTLVREHVTPNFTATGTLGRQAEGYKPMYGFAGVWSGSMTFSDNPDRKIIIEIFVPVGCKAGNTCGGINNYTGECGVSMTLKTTSGEVFEYELPTNTIVECPYGGTGTLTLQSDGTLLLEHTSPNFTANAVLSRK